MKNVLLVFAFCFLISFPVSGQMQTKFWELELGKSYTSINEAALLIKDRCSSYRINGDVLSAFQGRFGGYNWDFIDFTFTGGSERCMFVVEFVNYYETKEDAVDMATPLYQSLKSKYGMPEKVGTIEYRWSFQENAHVCILKVFESESKSGDVYWYAVLTYSDIKAYKQTASNEDDEL